MSEIVWLASYPKSGNTWMRAFLSNYLENNTAPARINELTAGAIASSRLSFEELVGVESSELPPAQIENCRPMVYRLLAQDLTEPLFLKVHDAYQNTPAGEPMFPADVTRGVVYLVRHPCDVAISYAHHSQQTVARAIEFMRDPSHMLAGRPDRLDFQLEQKLLTWSQHVVSWVDSGLPCHIVRYEDMLAHPTETFGMVIRFVGLEYDAERLARAIAFSDFQELQAQEQQDNFIERPPRAPNFFRQGKAGEWRNVLTPAQVAALVDAHAPIMQRFGYLDAQGKVL